MNESSLMFRLHFLSSPLRMAYFAPLLIWAWLVILVLRPRIKQIPSWSVHRQAYPTAKRSESRDRKTYTTLRRAKETELYAQLDTLDVTIRQAQQKHRRIAKEKHRKHYFRNSHTKKIERQLNGSASQRDEHIEPIAPHQVEERSQVESLLCQSATEDTPKEGLQRRLDLISNMTKLCACREIRRQPKKIIRIVLRISRKEEKCPDPEPFLFVCKPTQCPFCIRNESIAYLERTFTYCRPVKMMHHVERSHLTLIKADEAVLCRHPICKLKPVILKHIQHYKSHVHNVHGITLRAWNSIDCCCHRVAAALPLQDDNLDSRGRKILNFKFFIFWFLYFILSDRDVLQGTGLDHRY